MPVRRVVAVAVGRTDPLAVAMLEDVVDLLASMLEVETAVVATASTAEIAAAVRWPQMPMLSVSEPVAPLAVLAALHAAGADEGTVVAPDAPDLPPLLLGKLHSALTGATVAVCPDDRGGLVALAARLPAATWLADLDLDFDRPDLLSALRSAAPRRELSVGAGWHRVRGEADLARLDRGLEGWEATRGYLDAR
jgi:hypothetical protein